MMTRWTPATIDGYVDRRPDGTTELVARCPSCRQWHRYDYCVHPNHHRKHGRCNCPPSTGGGMRAGDCPAEQPSDENWFAIREVGPWTEAMRDQHTEGDRDEGASDG